MLPILFVLISMTAFGISNVCWKPLIAEVSISRALYRRSRITVIGLGAALLFGSIMNLLPVPAPGVNGVGTLSMLTLSKGVAAILLSLAGLYLFIYSMNYAPAYHAGLTISLSSILSAMFGCLLLNDPFSVRLLMAFILAITGVLLLDRPKASASRTEKTKLIRGSLLAVTAATCWAIGNFGFKSTLQAVGAFPFSFLQETVVLLVSGTVVMAQKHERESAPQHRTKSLIPLIASLTIVGVICNNLGMDQLPLSIFGLLVLAQPLTTAAVAYIWLRERPTITQLLGSILLLAGVYTGITA
jgi:drug/metabolite transporter (DMT)-like permease